MFLCFYWSVKCMSQVSKLHNFFLTYLETKERLKFESFFNFPVHFLLFFIWSVNCSSHFLAFFLLGSKLFESSIWIMYHILKMPRNLHINLYLKLFSIGICGKLSKLFFSVLFGGYKSCFETKNCSNFSYICVFIFPKKQKNLF